MASSSENISPLAALAPLHDLAQLVPIPSESPIANPSSASKEQGRNRAYILLTSLKFRCVVCVPGPSGWALVERRMARGRYRRSSPRRHIVCTCECLRSARCSVRLSKAEIGIASEGDDFGNMKLVLGTKAKKPLRLALSELDRETVARFAFEYFVRVAEDAKAHGCRIFHGNIAHTDSDHTDHLATRRFTPSLEAPAHPDV
ncbi:hypothetical protein F5148DRAFT_635858 [Russula earlei]|uniref:Uncharacterized protein n=1 Tax=Russula earlei TaxID=71964 RepID=A0ACC0UER7_9AGAM|nr:hypothetical protein F5148DRAFT_635858 [Russula earlei]